MALSSSSSSSDSDNSDIEAEFDFVDLQPKYKKELLPFLKAHPDAGTFAQDLCGGEVGSVIISNDPEIVVGFIGMCDIQKEIEKTYCKEYLSMLIKRSEPHKRKKLETYCSGTHGRIALVTCERMINVPFDLIPQLYTTLLTEIHEEVSVHNDPEYKFDLFLFVTSFFEEVEDEDEDDDKKKTKRRKGEKIFLKPEEEYFFQQSSFHLTYSLNNPSKECPMTEKKTKQSGLLFFIEPSSLSSIINNSF